MGGTVMIGLRDGVAAAVAIAAAGVISAGCATADPASHPAGARTSVAARVLVPPGGSPAEARAVGRRMLASLILPRGAHRIAWRSQPPRSETIGGADVVDVSRFYWLPLPEFSALAFLNNHVPAGTSLAGTGSGTDPTFWSVQYTLKAPPVGLEQFNMLLATLVAGPMGGTLMRADAELIWYPPRSAAEYVQVAGYRSVAVIATLAGPTPLGKARTIRRVFTSQAVIARLARLLDGMHATAPWSGSCPAILPQFRIMFTPKRHAASTATPLSVTASGCRGELITAGGQVQPGLEDVGSSRLLAVIGPLLGMHHAYW